MLYLYIYIYTFDVSLFSLSLFPYVFTYAYACAALAQGLEGGWGRANTFNTFIGTSGAFDEVAEAVIQIDLEMAVDILGP